MTKIVEFSMKDGRSIIDLPDVIPAVVTEDFNWHFLEFHGIAQPPNNLSMDEFEDAARSSGYAISLPELLRFAKNCNQTWDCLIVGLTTREELTPKEHWDIKASITIEGFDSETWTIRSKDEDRLVRLTTMLASRSHPFKQSVI